MGVFELMTSDCTFSFLVLISGIAEHDLNLLLCADNVMLICSSSGCSVIVDSHA